MASGDSYTLKWGIMATGGIAESEFPHHGSPHCHHILTTPQPLAKIFSPIPQLVA